MVLSVTTDTAVRKISTVSPLHKRNSHMKTRRTLRTMILFTPNLLFAEPTIVEHGLTLVPTLCPPTSVEASESTLLPVASLIILRTLPISTSAFSAASGSGAKAAVEAQLGDRKAAGAGIVTWVAAVVVVAMALQDRGAWAGPVARLGSCWEEGEGAIWGWGVSCF